MFCQEPACETQHFPFDLYSIVMDTRKYVLNKTFQHKSKSSVTYGQFKAVM